MVQAAVRPREGDMNSGDAFPRRAPSEGTATDTIGLPMNDHHAGGQTAALIEDALAERFGAAIPVDPSLPGLDELLRIAAHRVHRRFQPRAVEPALLRLL